MAFQPVKGIVRQVKPILSTDREECRRRVIALYKAWYRQIPPTVVRFNMPLSITDLREKLKKEFLKHKDVTDIRVIDMLVIKGQLDLKETVMGWKQGGHVLQLTKDSYLPKPNDFLSKFLSGSD